MKLLKACIGKSPSVLLTLQNSCLWPSAQQPLLQVCGRGWRGAGIV